MSNKLTNPHDVPLNFSLFGNKISTEQVDLLAESLGRQNFCNLAAEYLVSLARPEAALPKSLIRFQLLVREGVAFFLSRISYERVRETVLAQARLSASCHRGERLLHLARQFPTLHKLGQIIARTPGIDTNLKIWLIRLESDDVFSKSEDILGLIIKQLPDDTLTKIELSRHILAEASVAAVVPFSFNEKNRSGKTTGVFKVLKKDIGSRLEEELRLLSETAAYLEQDRNRYHLQEMMLTDLFAKVRESLAMEVDLAAERENLIESRRTYGAEKGLVIPQLFPFTTPFLTAMEYVNGTRITDTILPPDQRKDLARRVFQAVICLPLFSPEDSSLFHGDPHAGNILAISGRTSTEPDIALIDWTLAGRLPKIRRAQLMEMMACIVIGDDRKLRRSLNRLCDNPPGSVKVDELLAASSFAIDDPIKTAFHLLEDITMAGMVLPPELILFRKAFFTLEGVLNDLSPGFSTSKAMTDYLGGLLLTELPQRIGAGFLPVADAALQYKTLLSNQALIELTLSHSFALFNRAVTSQFAILEAQARFSASVMALMPPPLQPGFTQTKSFNI
jgi:ubiquinone biosynthesis protein